MYNYLKYANVTVQLADSRVLVYHKLYGGSSQRTVTREVFLCNNESPLSEANKILWHIFGINVDTYGDAFAEIKQLSPFEIAPNRRIYPYIVRMKSALAFQALPEDQYVAMDWYAIVDDMIVNSGGARKPGSFTKHTPTAILTIKKLHASKVFD